MSDFGTGEMPLAPPLAEAQPPVPGAGTFDALVDRRPMFVGAPMPEAAPMPETKNGFFTKARVAVGAGALVVASFAGYGAYRHFSGGNEHSSTPSAQESFMADQAGVVVCPDGMFPRGLYESNLAISTPGDLNTRPSSELKNVKDLTKFEFGKNGVACDGAATLGTIKMAMLDIMGDGSAKARGFDAYSNIDQQIGIYTKNKSAAKEDAKALAGIFETSANLNPKTITGPYQQIVGVENSDGSVTPAFKKVDKNFAPNTVFEFTATTVNGDSPDGDRTQVFLIDRTTGQMFVRNSIGLKELKPHDKPTSAKNNKGKSGGSSAPSGGKAVGKVKEQNSGPADNNANVGPTPEAATNGTDNTPGGGSGGGGGETGTTTPGSTTPGTTTPGTTSPPNTVPPTTAPPTTNAPKGTDPGCQAPNPACS